MASLAHADALTDKRWIHGSRDCAQNRDPPIEVFELDSDTYLLRQNKCVHFEAPFKAADAQFRGRPGVTLVEPTSEGVREYFKFKDWPKG